MKGSYPTLLFPAGMKHVSPDSKKFALWRVGKCLIREKRLESTEEWFAKPKRTRTMSDLRRGGHHRSDVMCRGPEVVKRKKEEEEIKWEKEMLQGRKTGR